MRHPPCPSYDVPSRSELAREAMDEARAEARQDGYDEGHERGWVDAMSALSAAMRATLATPHGEYEYQRTIPRETCAAILDWLDERYPHAPSIDAVTGDT
jgi:hypothetical protein